MKAAKPIPAGWADRVYRAMLLLYPRAFRDRFGDEMAAVFHARRLAAQRRNLRSVALFWLRAVADLAESLVRQKTARAGVPRSRTLQLSDVRNALRYLRRSPGSSLAITLLLALAIGAASSVFSVVNAVLLQPLPFGTPDRIVAVWEARPDRAAQRNNVSGHEFPVWNERTRVFDRMAAITVSGATMTGVGEPAALSGVRVTGGFFDVLSVSPIIGRAIQPQDDVPGRGQVVVLSHHLWRERFGGDSSVLGRSVLLNERPHVIIGVMGPSFAFPSGPNAAKIDFWAPIAEPIHLYRGRHYLTVVARLRPDVTVAQAQEDMTRIANDLARELPDFNDGHAVFVVGLHDDLVRDARPSLLLLLGAVCSLLLIGCSNVAGLLLARGLARAPEFAVRLALGAGRLGVARQVLVESVLLAAAGTGLGVAATYWFVDALPALVPRDLFALGTVSVDRTVLAFAALVAVVIGLLFGLAPALQVRHIDMNAALKRGSRSVAGVVHPRLRACLVTGQIALTLMLVASAGLMIRGLVSLQRVDPGLETTGVLSAELSLPASRYASPERQRQLASALLSETAALPGAGPAAIVNAVPLTGAHSGMAVTVENRPASAPREEASARYRVVSTGYFDTLKIPIKSGRVFQSSDARLALPLIRWFPEQPAPPGSDLAQPAPVAVINETMARQYWPGGSPLDRRFRVLFSPWITVVGVVADTRSTSLREPPVAEFYLHDLQEPSTHLSLLVRTTGDPSALAPALRSAIWKLDSQLAIESTRTLADVVGGTLSTPRFTSAMVGAFAVLALLLMSAGVYGLMAFTTSQRLPEIAVRMALGADGRDLFRSIVRHALLLASIGVAIGALGTAAVARLLEAQLYGLRPVDPATWAAVVVVIALSVIASAWWPARLAARVDPVRVFRL